MRPGGGLRRGVYRKNFVAAPVYSFNTDAVSVKPSSSLHHIKSPSSFNFSMAISAANPDVTLMSPAEIMERTYETKDRSQTARIERGTHQPKGVRNCQSVARQPVRERWTAAEDCTLRKARQPSPSAKRAKQKSWHGPVVYCRIRIVIPVYSTIQ